MRVASIVIVLTTICLAGSGCGEDVETCSGYVARNGVIALEAETLPIGESWEVQDVYAGYSDAGYIVWTGESHNNDPTNGVMAVDLTIDDPGRYQLDWYVRIGRGDNTTEHNDAWVRFPDAADYYGLKGEEGAEIRRYFKPKCEDQAAMAEIESRDDVRTADCARGSTQDGWMKVYSSGASDWKWSARTSDNDGSIVTVEFPEPGVYTMELAARADFFAIDRIALKREGVEDDVARQTAPGSCENL